MSGRARLASVLALLLCSTTGSACSCTGDLDATVGGGGSGGEGTGGGGGTAGGGAYGGGTVTPSGFLLISEDRLAELEQAVAEGSPEWNALQANVEENFGEQNINNSSIENYALAYLLTGDVRYADEAYQWVSDAVLTADVTSGSYLGYGELMRPAAMVLNYCYEALSEAQRAELVTFLDSWTNELWFDNQGSGWGLEDPGNNYHMAFVQGSAYAGYALREVGHENGQKYIDLVKDKLERTDGVMEYLADRVGGGDWHEGANYGERSKQRLFDALSVVVSMGDDNYFNLDAYFANSIYFAFYQLQPDELSMYPSGDLARDSAMPTSPYTREHVQVATFWLIEQENARGYGQYYLDNITPTYDEPGFRGLIYQDLLYELGLDVTNPDTLPTSYDAEGTHFVNMRSAWNTSATSVTIAGTPLIDQSHAHVDAGSFTIFKRAWLAVDAVTYSDSGLSWGADAHNMVHVPGHERTYGEVPGLTEFYDDGDVGYVQVDASSMFKRDDGQDDVPMLDEYTRELVYLRPDVLVVYDRVDPRSGAEGYDWRMHFAEQPSDVGGAYQSSYGGGGITLQTLLGGSGSIQGDGDLMDYGSDSWRVSVSPTGTVSRFLHVIEVADGSAPSPKAALVTGDGVDGAVWQDQVVVFSASDFGAAASLPFTYTVPTDGSLEHTLVNMTGSVDVSVNAGGGSTTVTVQNGNALTASGEGVIQFTD